MKKISGYLFAVVFLVLTYSCQKDNPAPVVPPKVTTGVFILNQGLYGANNTTLTYYDFSSQQSSTDFFKNTNGFGLGDTGSDMVIYGGKLYIVINNSGYVAVANALTAKFLDTIGFKNAGVNRGPENIIAAVGKVFVSSTDGTVAVIDLNSLTESTRIKVGLNPGSIAADEANNIYVSCTGNYGSVGPSLVKVDLSTNQVIKTVDSAVGTIRYYNNTLITTGGYLGTSTVGILNPTDLSAIRTSFIIDGTHIQNPYGLDIDPSTGDVYIGDAKDYVSAGQVYCFDKTGNKKFLISVSPGISPIRTVWVAQ